MENLLFMSKITVTKKIVSIRGAKVGGVGGVATPPGFWKGGVEPPPNF